jgi:pyruvate/2-oxoglutarate dehydrogenase complex dihydrolipoamide acyltransferase (E2) component
MATEINFTKPGMGVDEGTLLTWHKQVGDPVQKGQLVAEIETAKAVVEIDAPVAGTLVRVLVEAGETIPVNTPLGLIE